MKSIYMVQEETKRKYELVENLIRSINETVRTNRPQECEDKASLQKILCEH